VRQNVKESEQMKPGVVFFETGVRRLSAWLRCLPLL
jgi:hypothetical protein